MINRKIKTDWFNDNQGYFIDIFNFNKKIKNTQLFLQEIIFLKKYINDNNFNGAVLGILGNNDKDKIHLIKSLESELNNEVIFVNINIPQIIDFKDYQYTSLKREVIKELHKIAFNQVDETLFFGKRVDFGATDLVNKHKKRLKKLRLTLIISLVLIIIAVVTFISYAIINENHDIMSAPTIVTLLFGHIWTHYYNEQKLCKTIHYDILKTNYEYYNHVVLILKKLAHHKIVFVFNGIDDLDQEQIFNVLNELWFFLGHNNIKVIILLNDIQLLNNISAKLNVTDYHNRKKMLYSYFNYSLRLEMLSEQETYLFFDECYHTLSEFVDYNWKKDKKGTAIANNIKKITIANFVFANKNISIQQIVVDLNAFIAIARIQFEYNSFYYEELIRILIISCLQSRFIEIFIELMKDETELIWKTIIRIIINNEPSYVYDFMIGLNQETESWILKIVNKSSEVQYQALKRDFQGLKIKTDTFNDFEFINFLFRVKKYLKLIVNEKIFYRSLDYKSIDS